MEITIKIEYEDGNTEVKKWNGTLDTARQYYEGKYHRVGNDEQYNIQECINVKLVY